MTYDPTENARRARIAEISADGPTGRTWTTDELTAEFEVQGFLAPYVVVRRRADGVRGTLEFAHSPRVYFNWQAAS